MTMQQSFLVASLDKDKAASYISDLLKRNEINPLDINFQKYEKAMGIEDARNIQKAILLKPFKGKIKAVIIDTYEDITIEAQNALLKILEEPPANTIIIISTSKKDRLLPTIISRCKVIILQEKEISLTEKDNLTFKEILSTLQDGRTEDKLKIAETVAKDKENFNLWLEKMALFVKNKLLKENNSLEYLNFLKELQKTYKIIKNTNVNQRVALENLFLAF